MTPVLTMPVLNAPSINPEPFQLFAGELNGCIRVAHQCLPDIVKAVTDMGGDTTNGTGSKVLIVIR